MIYSSANNTSRVVTTVTILLWLLIFVFGWNVRSDFSSIIHHHNHESIPKHVVHHLFPTLVVNAYHCSSICSSHVHPRQCGTAFMRYGRNKAMPPSKRNSSFLNFRLYNSAQTDDDEDGIVRNRRRRQQQQQQINYDLVRRAIALQEQKQQKYNNRDTFVTTTATSKSQQGKLVLLKFRKDGYIELPTSVDTKITTSTATITSDTSPRRTVDSSDSKNMQETSPLPAVSLIRCLVLQQQQQDDDPLIKDKTGSDDMSQQPTLLIPLLEGTDWWLLSQQSSSSSSSSSSESSSTGTLTKFDLRRQNSIVINHPSNGLYNNLPYHWYNPDTKKKQPSSLSVTNDNGDVASLSSFGGKRECYNILLGKDWYLWNTKPVDPVLSSTNTNNAKAMTTTTISLQGRIVQLQQQELESQLAECDSEIAYLLQQQQQQQQQRRSEVGELTDGITNEKDLQYWQQQRIILLEVRNNLATERKQTEAVESSISSPFAAITNTIFSTIRRSFGSFKDETNNLETSPPSSATAKSNVTVRSTVPYRNTYDMIHRRIIQDTLNADVVGVMLENMSLLDMGSGMAIGGLVILKRKASVVQLMGEMISLPSSLSVDDLYFVECHVDEAIGMSMACQLPLWIADETWKRGTVMCSCNPCPIQSHTDPHKYESSIWYSIDPELTVLVEGQSLNVSRSERVLPIRIPRITNLYDSVAMISSPNQQQKASTDSSYTAKDLFPTDNMIQSLQQYDQMSVDDKARIFMAMSNTQQIPLPRRRSVEQNPQILDDLLMPYIDESVRYEYIVRTAQRNGDVDLIQELEQQQSMRSKARINRADAENANDDLSLEYWDKEVEFYSSLRADVTQDVGSYSRFLDRDEWYERDRQRMVRRMLERDKIDGGTS